MLDLQAKYQNIIHPFEEPKSGWGLGGGKKQPQIDQSTITSQVVDLILKEAILARSSDIHFEPSEKFLRVRYRIDGKLHEVLKIFQEENLSVIARLKVMAQLNMDAVSGRISQDGRFAIQFGNAETDFRISTFPTVYGEKVAIRILNDRIGLHKIEDIVMDLTQQKRMHHLINNKHGLILVSGPTGSGKTTTLYSLLNELNKPERNICTLEDPVEYQIKGINQCDIKSKSDFQFSEGLKAILRQDPDVVFVGELRDQETAEIALRASMTGHLVISTIHANSAVGTVTRLINMGLDRYMVSYSLTGAITQRLVRRICEQCKQPYQVTGAELARYGLKINKPKPQENEEGISYDTSGDADLYTLYKGSGCAACHGTGYHDRMSIYEIALFDEEMRDAIVKGVSNAQLQQLAINKGMKPLMSDGLDKVVNGFTTLEEVSAVIFAH